VQLWSRPLHVPLCSWKKHLLSDTLRQSFLKKTGICISGGNTEWVYITVWFQSWRTNQTLQLYRIRHFHTEDQKILWRFAVLDDKARDLSMQSRKYKQDAKYLNLRSTYAKIGAICVVIVLFLLFLRYFIFWWPVITYCNGVFVSSSYIVLKLIKNFAYIYIFLLRSCFIVSTRLNEMRKLLKLCSQCIWLIDNSLRILSPTH